jgi:hypothetical protein
MIPVSPRHSVRIASEYEVLLERAPQRDYVVRTITKRQAGGLPIMTAEIVIASRTTRETFPLAKEYPLHFKKTYFAGRLHGDTKLEFDYLEQASRAIDLPPPIGHTPDEFRTCLVPGTPYDRLSPFGVEPDDANLRIARDLPTAAACGLWRLLEEAFSRMTRLHAAGISHGDAQMHNFIVCPAPLEVVPIDFESAAARSDLDAEAWASRREGDLGPLLREALFVQCALGAQRGPLGAASLGAANRLFAAPERFTNAIDHQADLEPQ